MIKLNRPGAPPSVFRVVMMPVLPGLYRIEEKDLFQQLSKVEAHAQVESKGRGESEFVIAG